MGPDVCARGWVCTGEYVCVCLCVHPLESVRPRGWAPAHPHGHL